MRRLTLLLTVTLVPALVGIAPTAGAATAPRPVEPEVTTFRPSGVDRDALAGLRVTDDVLQGGRTSDGLAGGGLPDGQVAVLTEARRTSEFHLVGVTWDADERDVEVQVRVREDGRWSTWERLDALDEGPDTSSREHGRTAERDGAAPLLTDGADGVQVRVDTPDGQVPAGLQVDLIDGGESPSDEVASASTLGAVDGTQMLAGTSAGATAPPIITRRQWGADESRTKGPHVINRDVKALILHHTAGSNSYSRSQAFAQIRSIYAFHTGSRGWDDIGYNLLVDRFGRVFEGRRGSIAQPVRGAHSGGFNTNTYGIAVMGDFTATAAPAAAVDAVGRVMGWKAGQYGINPWGKALLVSQGSGTARWDEGTPVVINAISGHRDVGQTSCPGRYLYGRLSTLRSRAAALAPGTPRIDWTAYPRDWTDGRDADVLAMDREGRFHVYPGDGRGGFTGRYAAGQGWGRMDLVTQAGDLDGDRRPDVVARDRYSGELYRYSGDGRGRFSGKVRVGPGWHVMRTLLAPGDWDGDGHQDLIAMDHGGTLWLYSGKGNGGFRSGEEIGHQWWLVDLVTAVGDLDSDGNMDLVARERETQRLLLYRGDGWGGFSERRAIGQGWGRMTALVGAGDWNGDDRPDLLARDTSGRLYAYLGNGLGAVSGRTQVGQGWGYHRFVG